MSRKPIIIPAAVALALGIVGHAAAHTPGHSATCTAITASGTKYTEGGSVDLVIGTAHQHHTFTGPAFTYTLANPTPATATAWSIVIDSNAADGDATYTGSTTPCGPTTTAPVTSSTGTPTSSTTTPSTTTTVPPGASNTTSTQPSASPTTAAPSASTTSSTAPASTTTTAVPATTATSSTSTPTSSAVGQSPAPPTTSSPTSTPDVTLLTYAPGIDTSVNPDECISINPDTGLGSTRRNVTPCSAPTTIRRGLPATGADPSSIAGIAAALLTVGALAHLVRRRAA